MNFVKQDDTQQKTVSTKDSYNEFLRHFSIDKEAFFEWGISATIFPPKSEVESEWKSLKERIFSDKEVYIRGYGRDAVGTQLYINLYKALFNNKHVKKDRTNNLKPQKLIQRLTGLKRNRDIYNYQVSHIWGHTKNIFMFEAPWNICYTPKIIDPFTGHETQGIWPIEYKEHFIAMAYKLYKPFIDDYNQLLVEYDVKERLQQHILSLDGVIDASSLARFSTDADNELSPLFDKTIVS